MIKPVLQDDAFVEDVRSASADAEHFHLWWLGQSGFLLQWHGQHLLLDPYLSDSLTHKYSQTDKPHVRVSERVVPPEKLNFVDVVTSSHHHTDHLDAETLVPLRQANPKLEFLIPEANRDLVADRLQCPADWPRGLNAGQFTTLGGFKFDAVPAAHELVEVDARGQHRYLGYVIQFGPWTVYHSGDTVLYDGMVKTLSLWPIDVALLPINGRAPSRRVAGNLTGPEAAQLAQQIGARVVIPCHYDMFAFNTASPDEFVQEARRLRQAHRVLRLGERWSSQEIVACAG